MSAGPRLLGWSRTDRVSGEQAAADVLGIGDVSLPEFADGRQHVGLAREQPSGSSCGELIEQPSWGCSADFVAGEEGEGDDLPTALGAGLGLGSYAVGTLSAPNLGAP